MMWHNNKLALFFIYLLYAIHYFGKHYIVTYNGLIPNYLGDLICMPIVLSLTYSIMIFLKVPGFIKITTFHIFSATILFSIYFEWLLPNYFNIGTADIYDIIFYFAGALAYYRFFKPSALLENKDKVVA